MPAQHHELNEWEKNIKVDEKAVSPELAKRRQQIRDESKNNNGYGSNQKGEERREAEKPNQVHPNQIHPKQEGHER